MPEMQSHLRSSIGFTQTESISLLIAKQIYISKYEDLLHAYNTVQCLHQMFSKIDFPSIQISYLIETQASAMFFCAMTIQIQLIMTCSLGQLIEKCY